MISNHKPRFLFIHIPKCGGTSVEAALAKLLLGKEFREWSIAESEEYLLPRPGVSYQHSKLTDFSNAGIDVSTYFKFAFVRNPWDLVISEIFYFKKYEKRTFNQATIRESILHLLQRKKPLWGHDFKPQTDYLTDDSGQPAMDFVGRFERLEEDFRDVCEKMGLPVLKLPHLLATRDGRSHYSEYYDDETRGLVYERYRKDIETYGFEFHEKATVSRAGGEPNQPVIEPIAPGGKHQVYVTALTDTRGRIGHQLKDVFTGRIVSELTNTRYLHTPLIDPEWDLFLGLGKDAVRSDEITLENFTVVQSLATNTWTGMSAVRLAAFIKEIADSTGQGEVVAVFPASARVQLYQVYGWERNGMVAEGSFSRILGRIRVNYQAARHPKKKARPRWKAGDPLVIGVHIRRGDASTRNDRLMPLSYYTNIMIGLLAKFEGCSVEFEIHSSGSEAGMEEIVQAMQAVSPACRFKLNSCPFESFHEMVTADVLVTGHSSFGDWAGYLSQGIKIGHPHFDSFGLDHREWVRATASGEIIDELELSPGDQGGPASLE